MKRMLFFPISARTLGEDLSFAQLGIAFDRYVKGGGPAQELLCSRSLPLASQVDKFNIQRKKLEERVEQEHALTKKAYELAKKEQRAKNMAEEAHAKWELQMRETLKEREKDLVKLNYESRLLHHRGMLSRILFLLEVSEPIMLQQNIPFPVLF